MDDLELINVNKCPDFEILGYGKNKNWELSEWINLPQRNLLNENLTTKAKVLYSETGLYFLFYCEDAEITATFDSNFKELWKEDVVEVFIWPDESSHVYFEYELSPLNYELPIMVSNESGDIVRWLPFQYEADRKTRHATTVEGGVKKSYSKIKSWTAEFFLPFKLLRPITNVPPKKGDSWRANMCRIDYHDNRMVLWSWGNLDKNFHEYRKFKTFRFQ